MKSKLKEKQEHLYDICHFFTLGKKNHFCCSCRVPLQVLSGELCNNDKRYGHKEPVSYNDFSEYFTFEVLKDVDDKK